MVNSIPSFSQERAGIIWIHFVSGQMCISCQQPLQWLCPWHSSMTSPPVLRFQSHPSAWCVISCISLDAQRAKVRRIRILPQGIGALNSQPWYIPFICEQDNVQIEKCISCLTRIDHSLSKVLCTFSIKKLRIFKNLLYCIDQFSVIVLFCGSLLYKIIASGFILVCRVSTCNFTVVAVVSLLIHSGS